MTSHRLANALHDMTNGDHNADQAVPSDDHSLSIEEAAQRLNLSPPTVRRRIKQGKLRAYQRTVPTGFEWRIVLDHEHPAPAGKADQPVISAMPMPAQATINGAQPLPSPDLDRLVDLVDRLQRENQQLAGQLGFVQAKLQDAEEQIRLLMAPQEPEAARPEPEPAPKDAPGPVKRAPWWKWWIGHE